MPSAPLHIVFIITRADAVGGATVHVRDLARGLQDRGHRVLVLVGGTGEVLAELERHQVPYRSLRWLGRAIHPLKDALALAEIVRVLRELKPDLVCTHTAKAGFLGRLASSRVGIPAFYTPHGWTIGDRISSANAWIFRLMERAAGPRSASIINVCEAERELARRHRVAPDSKLAVIYNGVRDIAPGLRSQPSNTPPRLIMVARFEQPKDHATLLAALASLQDLAWTLELLGDGPQKAEMQQLASANGIASRVIFSGAVADVAGRLAEAQILVLSSRSEGFPLSILEAMRAGLPVVSSGVGGVREAVLDGETGFVVHPGDVPALAEALRLLITDPLLRQNFGRAGRRRFEMNFTFDQMLAQTLALYSSTMAARGSNAPLAREAAHGR